MTKNLMGINGKIKLMELSLKKDSSIWGSILLNV
jgi:hypothetical protein